MLAHVVVWAFLSSALGQAFVRRALHQRVQFVYSKTIPMQTYFWRV